MNKGYIEVNPTLYREIQNIIYENEKLQQENKQLQERMDKAIEYIKSIKMVNCRLFDYNRFLKEHLISLEELRKKVEEDGTLEGHFVEVNKDKLLEILKGEE